jgi:hypothetical protein
MPSVNVMRNVNLAIDRRGAGGCPSPTVLSCVGAGNNVLPYLPTTLNEVEQHWYLADSNGNAQLVATESINYGYITGSAIGTKLTGSVGSCTYDAIYMSGSLTFYLDNSIAFPSNEIIIGAVDGAFTISGNNGTNDWYALFDIDGGEITYDFGESGAASFANVTGSNQILSFLLGTYTGPFQRTPVTFYQNGNVIASVETGIGFASGLGNSAILQGEGHIRTFGQIFDTSAAVSGSTEYDCLFGL